ncbi:MAG TPA: alpha-N-acetylglucosaminidase [Actinopolymorphaceae bacterium]
MSSTSAGAGDRTDGDGPDRRPDPTAAAAALVRRVVGERRSERISVEVVDAPHDEEYAEVEADGGAVALRGTSGVAVAVALRHYLQEACGVSVTWLDEPLTLPDAWPSYRRTRVTARFPLRYHLNVVTFAYSTLWWDWARWEREIDRMALHGINAPLALTGHEAVWRAVLQQEGMTEDQIAAYLGGAPYLPFLWMGCLEGWDEPLPEGWIDAREQLGKRILERERSLGMRPVLPGFAGHIPTALADSGAVELTWEGFHASQLLPDHPDFLRIAARLRAEQRARFGGDHLYAADPFIEMVPPSGDPSYLAHMATRILEGITIDDPDAVWVFQAWPFYFAEDFWTTERVRAFLEAIPPDRVLVLDLWAEHLPLWKRTDGFADRPWLWSVVHNFGERSGLFGDLRTTLDRFDEAVQGDAADQLTGIGLAMEGLGTNPAFYDLVSELAWQDQPREVPRDGPRDVVAWLTTWATRRYGSADPRISEAWRVLADTVYGRGRDLLASSPVIRRPGLDDSATARWAPDDALDQLISAWRLLLDGAATVRHADAFQRDLVDVGQQVLVGLIGRHRRAITAAAHAGDHATVRAEGEVLVALLDDLDDLLATRREYLLGRWLAAARSWGTTPAERIHLARSARRLVTVWGHPDTNLFDYSGRHWAGLVRGFYRPRFEVWLDWIVEAGDGGGSLGTLERRLASFEELWIRRRDEYPVEPYGDVLEISSRLLRTWASPQQ